MAFDVEAAKQEGYTDEEIAAYLRAESGTPVTVQEEPSRGAEMAATLAPVAASYIPPIAGTALAGYGAYKYGPDILRSAGNIASKLAGFRSAPPPSYGMPGGTPIGTPVAPVSPAAIATPGPTNVPVSSAPANAGQQAFNQMGQQLTKAQPGMIQRGMDLAGQVRQAAAQRIMPAMGQAGQAMGQAGQAMGQAAQQAGSMFGKGLSAAAPALRVGGMASNALYSGDLNANELAELERRRKMQPTIAR